MYQQTSQAASFTTPPIFQEVITTMQGGFALDETTVAAGTLLPAGTLIGFDESTRRAKVGKVATLQASATNTATTYRVLKGSLLKVGDTFTAAGGTPRAITAFDTSNSAYDEITVGTTLGVALNAGDAVYINDAGFTNPVGLLFLPVEVQPGADVSVLVRGMVYARRIQPIPASLQAKMPGIIFSQSY